jgi:hypothetical protein
MHGASVTGNAITMDEARDFEHAQKKDGGDASPISVAPVAPDDADVEHPGVLSFAQLQALIEAGKADLIPNNKIIPEELNVRVSSGTPGLV